MSWQYPVPAVRLIIPNSDNQVLILRRAFLPFAQWLYCFPGVPNPLFVDYPEYYSPTKNPGGRWCLPGGNVDYDVTLEEAVIKELAEETSLECTEAKFLYYQDSLPLKAGGTQCINFYFECRVSGTVQLNEESSEFAWIGPDELDQYRLTFRNDWGLKRFWGIC
jgi:ADP-ribose pyrophosphatase YjhB (NUDIX family)